MSATGLDVFDKTLNTTNIWLDDITEKLGPDRKLAWKILSVVLHKVRDRVPIGLAAHLGAELPLMIRGVYYDQFDPAKLPADWSGEQFKKEVARWLSDVRPVDPDDAIRAVLTVLSRHLPHGQLQHVQQALPEEICALWSAAEERVIPPPEQQRSEMRQRM
jgi:uncharacterized protein (DUF2267 family)